MSLEERTCENCGKHVGPADNNNYGDPPYGIRYGTGGFLGFMVRVHYFCGDRCKREWRKNNEKK